MKCKDIKKLWIILLALVLTFSLTTTVFAAEGDEGTVPTTPPGTEEEPTKDIDNYEPTTYTIRILDGIQGKYTEKAVYKKVEYGKKITVKIDESTVNLPKDSEYYVLGLKEAGKDNKEKTSKTIAFNASTKECTITVLGDMDYVISYGVKGSVAKYTVNYLDQNGDAIAPSAEHYGNIGEKPVVSCIYVEGYTPAANALTKTLVEDESENVFTFYYRNGGGAIGDNTTVVNGNNANAANGNANANANANANNAVNVPGNQTPRDLVDLDNEETPMANMDLDEESGLPLGAIIGIVAAAIAVGAAILILVAKKRRKDEEAYNE